MKRILTAIFCVFHLSGCVQFKSGIDRSVETKIGPRKEITCYVPISKEFDTFVFQTDLAEIIVEESVFIEHLTEISGKGPAFFSDSAKVIIDELNKRQGILYKEDLKGMASIRCHSFIADMLIMGKAAVYNKQEHKYVQSILIANYSSYSKKEWDGSEGKIFMFKKHEKEFFHIAYLQT